MRSIGLHLIQSPLTFLAFIAYLALLCFAIPLSSSDTVKCTPIDWKGVFVFFLLNYVAHAVTVLSPPGANWWGNVQWQIVSLLIPTAAMGKAVALLHNHCLFGEDEIGRASAVGAIAVAARSTKWKPPTGARGELVYVNFPQGLAEVLEDAEPANSSTAMIIVQTDETRYSPDISCLQFHGQTTSLPDGYEWVIPSPYLADRLLEAVDHRDKIRIGLSQSYLKMASSIVQLIISSITIYRTRGPQLDRYGYAAFGLSVFPYTLMSIINLICIGMLGEYSCVYVLRTTILGEAERRGAIISGEIGILKAPEHGLGDVIGANEGVSNDGFTAARLWIEDSDPEEYLVVGVENRMRKFRLVDRKEDDTFVFRVSSITNEALPVQSNLPAFDPGLFVWRFYTGMVANFDRTGVNRSPQRRVELAIAIFIIIVGPYFAFFSPYIFIYCLTRFHKQESTPKERGFMITWLVAGQCGLVLVPYLTNIPGFFFRPVRTRSDVVRGLFGLYSVSLIIAGPIGGFVMVGKMLYEFGQCSLLP